MKITIKVLKGGDFQIDAEPTDTVQDLKAKIQKIRGTQGQRAGPIKIAYSGKILQDNETVESHGIKEKDFMVLVVLKPKLNPSTPSSAALSSNTPVQTTTVVADVHAPAVGLSCAPVTAHTSPTEAVPLTPEDPAEFLVSAASNDQSEQNSVTDAEKRYSEGQKFFRQFERGGQIDDLNAALSNTQAAVDLHERDNQQNGSWIGQLGVYFQVRYERLKSSNDLESAIRYIAQANALGGPDHPRWAHRLHRLGSLQSLRFGLTGVMEDLNGAVSNLEAVNALTSNDHEEKAMWLDIDAAISNMQHVIRLIGDQHPRCPHYYNQLGYDQKRRFLVFGGLEFLDQAISNLQKAVALVDDDHEIKPPSLFELGNAQTLRFENSKSLDDLAASISSFRKAVNLSVDGESRKPGLLCRLGRSLATQFDLLKNVDDINEAVHLLTSALDLASESHPQTPLYFNNLGWWQVMRYLHLRERNDLEASIANLQKGMRFMDKEHPSVEFPKCLGEALMHRFQLSAELSDIVACIANFQVAVELDPTQSISQLFRSRQKSDVGDLDAAISNLQHAVGELEDTHPDKPRCLDFLGCSQADRFESRKQLEDIENSIYNLKVALELTHEDHQTKRQYLRNLGQFQEEYSSYLDLGDREAIEETIKTRQKVVELGSHDEPTTGIDFHTLGVSLHHRYHLLKELDDLNDAISNYEKAAAMRPYNAAHDGYNVKSALIFLKNLGHALLERFERLRELRDIEASILNHQKVLELCETTDCRNAVYFTDLGFSQLKRYELLGEPGDLAISKLNLEKAVELTSVSESEEGERAKCLGHLGLLHFLRFLNLEQVDDIDASILNLDQAAKLLTHNSHDPADGAVHLGSLGVSQRHRFLKLGELTDIDASISNLRQAAQFLPRLLDNLAMAQMDRFDKLGKVDDLDASVVSLSNLQKHFEQLGTEDMDSDMVIRLLRTGYSYYVRYQQKQKKEDLKTCLSYFRRAAMCPGDYPKNTLAAADIWSAWAEMVCEREEAMEGYRIYFQTLQKVAWHGLDVEDRQDLLMKRNCETKSGSATTCAIELGLFEEGVSLLDAARSICWQQSLALRVDLNELKLSHKELAEDLESISKRLEQGPFTNLPSIGQESIQGSEASRAVRHALALEWDTTIQHIREQNGFEDFLRPLPFHKLRKGIPKDCTVVIINVSNMVVVDSEFAMAVLTRQHIERLSPLSTAELSRTGVNALTVHAEEPIRRIPLPNIDIKAIAELSRMIHLKRPSPYAPPREQQYYISRYLKAALRKVWEMIIVPIFTALEIPLKPTHGHPHRRIYWYPTGSLTFIPLHAAGPYDTADDVDVSRLVISSYTSTLRSLLDARSVISKPVASPKLLAVSQGDTPGQVPLPEAVTEVKAVVRAALLSGHPKSSIIKLDSADATVKAVSGAFEECSWIHLSCHGEQARDLGMRSSLMLHDGELTLDQIASKRLQNGRFAFLSACHAASGLEELPGEAMHLAAGVQFAGIPSVIATMWSICDVDAPVVASHVYKYLFRVRDGQRDIDPEDAATALNRAITELRQDPSVSLDRWAPFIHIGV